MRPVTKLLGICFILTLACCSANDAPDTANDVPAAVTETAEAAVPPPQSNRNSILIGNHHKLIEALHGPFLINKKDTFIGKSLDVYGEWEQESISLLSKLIKPGQIVLDVGANIGA